MFFFVHFNMNKAPAEGLVFDSKNPIDRMEQNFGKIF